MADFGLESAALSAYVRKLESTISDDARSRITMAAGIATRKAAVSAVEDKLGPDRAMSNFRSGRVKLGAGFDVDGWTVKVNHRPKGVWLLADAGRKRSGIAYPRTGANRGRKGKITTPGRAVLTPYGPRASHRFGPSRGTGVFEMAAAREREEAPKSAWRVVQGEFARIIRR